MNPDYVAFLQGVTACGAWVAGLFFLRFWRESGDRLFVYFGTAFWLLSLSWALVGLISPTEETRPYVYAIRLLAFLLLIGGIVNKNRSSDA